MQAIRSVINPDKLGHLGPVADARDPGGRCVTRSRQSRRPGKADGRVKLI